MPKKTIVSKTQKQSKSLSMKNRNDEKTSFSMSDVLKEETKRHAKSPWKIIFIAVVLLALFAVLKFKNLLIVGMVNGHPIPRWELSNQLIRRFGAQTLDGMINERLILAAVREKGILVTNKDIDAKTTEIRTSLKGTSTLEDALKAQGLTMDEFRRQIEIEMSIEKLFSKETTVSKEELDKYLAENKELIKSSTDPAQVRKQAESILKQQKLSENFNKWYSEIKKGAKIDTFL